MYEEKIETLKSALAAIEDCRKNGSKVDLKAIKAVDAAIHLNIRPPVVLYGRKPLISKGVTRAVAGSWPHFAKALANQELGLSELEVQAKAGDEAAKSRHGFLIFLLNAIHAALTSALQFAEEQKAEAENTERRRANRAKSEAELKAREEAEAARRARKAARKEAVDALMATAYAANEAPEVMQPGQRNRHQPLTLERVRVLINKETRKRGEEQGVDPSEAKLLACRFVYNIVLKTEAEGKHTKDEIEVMKAEVKSVVSAVKLPACKNIAEAQREADGWVARAEASARRQNSPQPNPDQRPRPERRGQPKPAPDGHIEGANVMEIALKKAGLGKTATRG